MMEKFNQAKVEGMGEQWNSSPTPVSHVLIHQMQL